MSVPPLCSRCSLVNLRGSGTSALGLSALSLGASPSAHPTLAVPARSSSAAANRAKPRLRIVALLGAVLGMAELPPPGWIPAVKHLPLVPRNDGTREGGGGCVGRLPLRAWTEG